MIREVFSEKVTFDLGTDEGTNHAEIWRKRLPGLGNSKSKFSEVKLFLEYSRESKQASMAKKSKGGGKY